MRPDPTLWGLQADRRPQYGLFGEPISAAICGTVFTLSLVAIPGRFFLSLVLELVR